MHSINTNSNLFFRKTFKDVIFAFEIEWGKSEAIGVGKEANVVGGGGSDVVGKVGPMWWGKWGQWSGRGGANGVGGMGPMEWGSV